MMAEGWEIYNGISLRLCQRGPELLRGPFGRGRCPARAAAPGPSGLTPKVPCSEGPWGCDTWGQLRAESCIPPHSPPSAHPSLGKENSIWDTAASPVLCLPPFPPQTLWGHRSRKGYFCLPGVHHLAQG